jgi:hypothetical protein
MELLAAFVKLLHRPIQRQQQHFSSTLMGPYKLAGSMFNMAAWSHTKTMAALIVQLPRPIQTSQQHVSGCCMGPYKLAGNMFNMASWAHTRRTAALLKQTVGSMF